MSALLIGSLLLNVLMIYSCIGGWMQMGVWRRECERSRIAHEIQTRVTLRIWNYCVKKWRETHQSIPTAFLEIALHVEDLERGIEVESSSSFQNKEGLGQ